MALCLKPWSSVWLFLLYQEMLSSKGGQHFSQCFRKSLLRWGDFPLRRDLANTQNRPWGEREGGLWLETGGGSRARRSPAHPVVLMAAASSAWPCPGAGRADSQPTCISRAMCVWVTLSKSLKCCMALVTKFGSVNPQDRPKYMSLIVPTLVLGDSVSPLEKSSVSLLKRVEILPFLGKIFKN